LPRIRTRRSTRRIRRNGGYSRDDPAGTTYARFSLFDADVAPGSDIDMYVYQGATLVAAAPVGRRQKK